MMSSSSAGNVFLDAPSTSQAHHAHSRQRHGSGETARERAQDRGSAKDRSPVTDVLSSFVPNASNADAPSSSSYSTRSLETRKLWSAVKTSVRLAASPRKRKDDDEEWRFDEEGMSSPQENVMGRGRNRSSGAHLDQWSSVVHFLDEGKDEETTHTDDQGRIRGESSKPHRKRKSNVDPDTTITSSETPPHTSSKSKYFPENSSGCDKLGADYRSSISEEPDSMISSDPASIPGNEDPLAYNSGTLLLDDETDSETDDAEEQDCTPSSTSKKGRIITKIRALLHDGPSLFTKTVIKCVLSYFIASLFTYSPYLSHQMASLLPNHDHAKIVPISNLHLIATVAVYFHPGRSLGSMVEAIIYAMAAFLYAILLGLSSMLVAVFLHDHNLPLTSNAVSVIVFLGFGMGLVGYAKVKLARPTFNTACSLIGVIVFSVVVAEGSAHLGRFSTEKIWQVTAVVLTGVMISNVVCFVVWPTSACTSLQRDIRRNLESFSTLLKVLTKAFLMDDIKNFNVGSEKIKVAIDDHHRSFTSLKNNLADAKLEAPFDMRIRGRVGSYVAVVNSLNVLAQHLGGLRSSCGQQNEIILSQRARMKEQRARRADEHPVASQTASKPSSEFQSSENISGYDLTLKDFDERFAAFSQFLESVGPHMRSLVFTCSRTLKSLTAAFATTSSFDTASNPKESRSDVSFDGLNDDVSAALKRFQHEQTIAIKRLYTVYPQGASREDGKAEEGVNPTNKSDEDIFLIFYFVFLLEEFSKELETLVEALEVIRQEELKMRQSRERVWWKKLLRPYESVSTRKVSLGKRKMKRESHSFWKTVACLFIPSSPSMQLPSTSAHQENTTQTPAALTVRARVNRCIWKMGQFLKEADTKFAIKTGLGCATLASPAFIKSTRRIFTQYKGQWALITFMVVLSPTVGQSNQMSVHRILGTLLGATAALIGYFVFPDDDVALPIFGALFSIPCWCWIIGKPQFAPSGRFVLLTFNLTALYSYNVRKVGIEVEEIAFQRTAAVVIGVIWATILNNLVWPFEARRELARGMSDLLFKLGFLYQRLVLSYSLRQEGSQQDLNENHDVLQDEDGLENQPLLVKGNRSKDEIQMLELSLQVHLIKLEGLLSQTKHEPRLKGPFPVETYRQFIRHSQNILDLLHTMNQVTSRSDWHTRVRKDFIIPVDRDGQRREMVGNVVLFFWLLASAFHLKTPLPPFLPPAETSRREVLKSIRQLPVVKKRATRGSSEYLLYFAYALSMKDLIHQLEDIGKLAQSSFGVLGGSVERFEEQFRGESTTPERAALVFESQ
ncbi:hypothetical protein CBS101457_000788 [Exobasidium rhododendri]|nr:hypothetical protein CBS101457_000788 [Exobasidium rhododendri]